MARPVTASATRAPSADGKNCSGASAAGGACDPVEACLGIPDGEPVEAVLWEAGRDNVCCSILRESVYAYRGHGYDLQAREPVVFLYGAAPPSMRERKPTPPPPPRAHASNEDEAAHQRLVQEARRDAGRIAERAGRARSKQICQVAGEFREIQCRYKPGIQRVAYLEHVLDESGLA